MSELIESGMAFSMAQEMLRSHKALLEAFAEAVGNLGSRADKAVLDDRLDMFWKLADGNYSLIYSEKPDFPETDDTFVDQVTSRIWRAPGGELVVLLTDPAMLEGVERLVFLSAGRESK